jgi:prepilin-type N-terminal cleavage/methylation domain-containing protein
MRLRHQAFTLIELLVVIAIIAVLAAILFPVFAQARERARQTACLSNSKQLATALYMYAQDYDENIVPASLRLPDPTLTPIIWTEIAQPYIKNTGIFICPSADNRAYAQNWGTRQLGSYGYNESSAIDQRVPPLEGFPEALNLAAMDEPARGVLLADTPGAPIGNPSGNKYRGYVFNPYNGQVNSTDVRLSTPRIADRDLVLELNSLPPAQLKPVYCRHFKTGTGQGTASLVFADGHAKTYSANSLLAQDKGANLIWRFR